MEEILRGCEKAMADVAGPGWRALPYEQQAIAWDKVETVAKDIMNPDGNDCMFHFELHTARVHLLGR